MLLLNRQSVSAVLALPLLARYGYLKESGWLKSRNAGVPVDKQDRPLPWFTYPSIDFLKDRVSKEMDVFEYGAGNSTLWWADRVGQVVTCEHDENWYERMLDLVPDNVDLHHLSVDGGEYAAMISRHQSEFDIVEVAPLRGATFLTPSYNPVSKLSKIRKPLQGLAPQRTLTEDDILTFILDLDENGLDSAVKVIRDAHRQAVRLAERLHDIATFLSDANLDALNGWGGHNENEFKFTVERGPVSVTFRVGWEERATMPTRMELEPPVLQHLGTLLE